ncbi:hypothetical protein QEG73_19235 [Chitinophagaceae bacterium 26-R-25]|nr:hypothetical protein [Chitinophagaceae bacterium 26-R-25]
MKRTYPLLLVAILFAACNAISARSYNNMCVAKENALIPQIEATESSVGTFAQENKFDSVAAVSQRMVASIDKTIGEIEKAPLPSVNGSEDFKKAYLDYFRYMKKVYIGYKKWGLAKNDEERNTEIQNVRALIKTQSMVLVKMQSAQRKFAADNNLTLEKK